MRLWGLLLLIACGQGEREREAVAEICTTAVSCNSYGWSDQSECEGGWIDNDDYGTECAYNGPYLECAAECLDSSCERFEDCEAYCWVSHCL